MRLDNLGGGSAQVRAIFMRQNGMETETLVNNNRSRVVPQDAVSVALVNRLSQYAWADD